MSVAIAATVLTMTAGARLLPLDRVAAPTAIVTWLCVLSVGAISTISAAALAIIYLPETAIYSFVASLCLHVTFPVVSPHIGFSGHTALHAAMVLPMVGLLGSTVWLMSRLTNGWWTLRSRLRGSIETNDGFAIIEDDEIVLGVAPLGRGRIVVSDTALRTMDPAELEAGLSHEAGHIRRGHRSITVVARVLAAIGFVFPGTRHAQRNLIQALERDADAYAVRQTRDPLALASAICKAATGPRPAQGIGLAGGMINRRLDYLEGHRTLAGPSVRRFMSFVAIIFVAATMVFAASASAWALNAPAGNHAWSIGGTDC
jgi:Zn-dependent protease with chaperone function